MVLETVKSELLFTDAHLRGLLRDTIRRLQIIKKKSGRDGPTEGNGEAESAGSFYQRLVESFITTSQSCKVLIEERVKNEQSHSDDTLETLERNHSIRQKLHRLKQLCDEMKVHVDRAEHTCVARRKKAIRKNEEQLRIFEQQCSEWKEQHVQCLETMHELRQLAIMHEQRVQPGSGKPFAIREANVPTNPLTQLSEALRPIGGENLYSPLGNASSGGTGGGENVWTSGWPDSGGTAGKPTDRYKKDQVELAQQEAQIDASIDRLKSGVSRLKEIASSIQTVLDEDEHQIGETTAMVDRQHANIQSMSRHVREAIRQTSPSNCFLYVLVIIFILVAFGYILFFLGAI